MPPPPPPQSSPLTNSGLGSNLSLTGQVECDASVMDGDGGFGSVGALQGTLTVIWYDSMSPDYHVLLRCGEPHTSVTGDATR